MQDISNKFIEIKIYVGYMVWPWCCLLQNSQRQKKLSKAKISFAPMVRTNYTSIQKFMLIEMKRNNVFFHNHSFPWLLKTVQVNLCQKLLFLHQLTHNMTTDCSLNYQFSTWKFQLRTCQEHVVYTNCFLFLTFSSILCTQNVLDMFWAWNFHVLNS